MSELGEAAAAVEGAAAAEVAAGVARVEEAAVHADIRKDEIAAEVEIAKVQAGAAVEIARAGAEEDDEERNEWRENCNGRLASLETTVAEMSGQLTALRSLIPAPTPEPAPEPIPEAIPVETPPSPPSEPEKSEATKGKKRARLGGWPIW